MPGVVSNYVELLQGIMTLMTDTDITHDIVQRLLTAQRRRGGPRVAYHRLNAPLDATMLGDTFVKGDEESLKAVRAHARSWFKRHQPYEWAAVVDALRVGAGDRPLEAHGETVFATAGAATFGRHSRAHVRPTHSVHPDPDWGRAGAPSDGWNTPPVLPREAAGGVDGVDKSEKAARPFRGVRKWASATTGVRHFWSGRGT